MVADPENASANGFMLVESATDLILRANDDAAKEALLNHVLKANVTNRVTKQVMTANLSKSSLSSTMTSRKLTSPNFRRWFTEIADDEFSTEG